MRPVAPAGSVAEPLLYGLREAVKNTVASYTPAVQPPTRAEIRRAYYKVAAQVHPDKCACPCATKAFQILNGAYQALL